MAMKNIDLIAKVCSYLELNTMYMWGTYGSPITEKLVTAKKKQYPTRFSDERVKKLLAAAKNGTYYAFDCNGMIKGTLWLFPNVKYKANGVPDINVSGFKARCYDLSSDMSNIKIGELLFMSGHIGVYVGNGKSVECTLGTFGDGVVLTDIAKRKWTEHGKCEFIDYEDDIMTLQVSECRLALRKTLEFKNNKPCGKVLDIAKIGEEMTILEFIPEIQADGYQWVRALYNGKEGYAQLDTACYYIQAK